MVGGALLALPKSVMAQSIGGEGHEFVPEGTTDELEVVSVHVIHSDSLVALIRNNTKEAVGIRSVKAIARQDGELVALGDISDVGPYRVEAGEFAIARVYIGEPSIEDDWEFEFDIEHEEPEEDGPIDVEIIEASIGGEGVLGVMKNTHDFSVFGPFTLVGLAFDAKGDVVSDFIEYVGGNELKSGDTEVFEANLNGSEEPFVSFIIAITGYTY